MQEQQVDPATPSSTPELRSASPTCRSLPYAAAVSICR